METQEKNNTNPLSYTKSYAYVTGPSHTNNNTNSNLHKVQTNETISLHLSNLTAINNQNFQSCTNISSVADIEIKAHEDLLKIKAHRKQKSKE